MYTSALISRILQSSDASVEVDPASIEVVELVLAQEIELWITDTIRATLTPLAAERRGVELREFGYDEVPRFVRIDDPIKSLKLPPEWGRKPLHEVAWIPRREEPEPEPEAVVVEPVTPQMLMGRVVGELKQRIARSRKHRKRK